MFVSSMASYSVDSNVCVVPKPCGLIGRSVLNAASKSASVLSAHHPLLPIDKRERTGKSESRDCERLRLDLSTHIEALRSLVAQLLKLGRPHGFTDTLGDIDRRERLWRAADLKKREVERLLDIYKRECNGGEETVIENAEGAIASAEGILNRIIREFPMTARMLQCLLEVRGPAEAAGLLLQKYTNIDEAQRTIRSLGLPALAVSALMAFLSQVRRQGLAF